jgi:circadian clock protein KaiC
MPPRRSRTIREARRPAQDPPSLLDKISSGIPGLDEVTGGGLPKGRPTLVCGAAGCGKTLFAMQFLAHGAEVGEPGVFVSFEESADDLAKNFSSIRVDVEALRARKLVEIDQILLDPTEIEVTGEYSLDGLFVRLEGAIASVGAKRVVIDTLETVFAGLADHALLRAELGRLFRWLKARGVTAIVTAECDKGAITRYGLEEYVSDCVIVLDHRISNQVSTRRLRVVKYRGSSHGTNEYPFLIADSGLSVLPVTSLGLDYPVSNARVLSGIARLDAMLGARGYFRGSTILVSGTAGTGKSSTAAHFADGACRRGERCLFFALEEPASQIQRNMRSIGLDLEQWVKKGLLRFQAARPTVYGLEQHLVTMHALIEEMQPHVVVVDPISSLVGAGDPFDVKSMSIRLFDYLKMKGITTLLTYLAAPETLTETAIGISSLIDTWLLVRDVEADGERSRSLSIMKSRGMAHSNRVHELVITSRGVDIADARGDRRATNGAPRRTA